MNGTINTKFGLLNIQSLLFQVLETTYIIETSNSPDTVIGRCIFLKESFDYIIDTRKQPEFGIELQEVVDRYKQVYYDKPITQIQLAIVITATEGDFKILFFEHIQRSLYTYIDNQLQEISLLKRKDAREKRRSKAHDTVIDSNTEMLKLFFTTENDNPYLDKVSTLTRLLYNYIELKLNGFDQEIFIYVNEIECHDENKVPMTDAARKLIKEIKAKLWNAQFEIINQENKIKLTVNGDNIALTFDEKAGVDFTQKIKSLFAASEQLKI